MAYQDEQDHRMAEIRHREKPHARTPLSNPRASRPLGFEGMFASLSAIFNGRAFSNHTRAYTNQAIRDPLTTPALQDVA